jgi:winged helix DNA-binding protein
LLEQRVLVRTLLMRRTIHLVSARDCLALRALHQPMLAQRARSVLRSRLVGIDEAELATAGYPLFDAEPRLLTEVGRAVQERWPGAAARDLGDALSSVVPLVQVPPRGLWRETGPARNTTIPRWLGRELAPAPEPDALVLRYLAAFGPAAAADIRAWSGLSGLRPAVDRLRPDLRTFRDERGRVLLDLPDAPRPDPDTPAPPRFLPAFDNAVLGYDDRSRIIDAQDRGLSVTGARFLLVDGRVRATWTVRTEDGAAELRISALGGFRPGRHADEVAEEGLRLLALLAPDRPDHRVTWSPH